MLFRAAALLLLGMAGATAAVSEASPVFDVVFRNGTVFDGTGHVGVRADVAVKGGYIAAVGNLAAGSASIDIDAGGLYIAPGFINFHDHSEPDALPTAANLLLQGVTTSIVNPDGGGPTDVGAQLADYGMRPMAIDVGASIGFNAVWEEVVGEKDRRASSAEIARMRAAMEANLRRGAWNISAGLDYKPAYYASVAEVVGVVGIAAPWRTSFPNHDRLRPETSFSSQQGMAETLTIAEQAGLTPEVTHMKLQGHEQGSAALVLDRMRAAGARGYYVPADVYPYLAGQTGLADLIIPGWALDGGRSAFLHRIEDPTQRARIVREAERAIDARFNGAQGVYVIEIGRPLTRVMTDRNISAGEAVIQLLQRQEMSAILSFGRESDLVQILKYPAAAIACDCGASLKTSVHPRYYGTFPRVLGHYVREEHVLSWEDAIRKMTGLPATMLGMIDRGYVMPGMVASLTVFDPRAVTDRSTYERPTELPEGVRFVLVNGVLAVRDGKLTGQAAGKVLPRASDMPSRPESTTQSRSLQVSGRLLSVASKAAVSIEVRALQEAADERAHGRLSVSDDQGHVVLETDMLGLLQTTAHWASFTAYVSSSEEHGQAVSVVVDEADPLHPGVKWGRIRVEGKVAYEGPLDSPPTETRDPGWVRFRSLYQELVETNTTLSEGNCTLAAQRMAAHLRAAGYPDSDLGVFIPDGHPKEGGLHAVMYGSDPHAKAVLLLAHIDVVEAKRADWSRDPFLLTEEGGYFYGRGTSDMKAQAAIWVDNLIRLREEGFKPRRTIKLALTCGEETNGAVNGAGWLVTHDREAIDAAFALTEGVDGDLDAQGNRMDLEVLAAEKVSQNFVFEVTNPGGHSSRPVPDNAIYHLARAIDRVSRYEFPVQLDEANRAYFSGMAKIVGGATGAAMRAVVVNPDDAAAVTVLDRDRNWHAMLRTTCVATMLSAGHAANALPQRATANINCRIFPGVPVEEVRDQLVRVAADPAVQVVIPEVRGPLAQPSPLTPGILGPIEAVAHSLWPGIPVIPALEPAASDAQFLNPAGIPTYGVTGLFLDPDGGRIHGRDERIRVRSVYEGRKFLYQLVKTYAATGDFP